MKRYLTSQKNLQISIHQKAFLEPFIAVITRMQKLPTELSRKEFLRGLEKETLNAGPRETISYRIAILSLLIRIYNLLNSGRRKILLKLLPTFRTQIE
ncbi:hypothetical protein JP09_004755 [Dehalogenimonas etheniformans]|uniref:Uncharacterized protein n=1 Tax=Dehalogenimonas etheniformans TaxID=1536648 RepID=A0A2P5P7Z6_9CHLR|nr:hypothetical protein JP09_004755 [Dehalogenimonas etheniformans]